MVGRCRVRIAWRRCPDFAVTRACPIVRSSRSYIRPKPQTTTMILTVIGADSLSSGRANDT